MAQRLSPSHNLFLYGPETKNDFSHFLKDCLKKKKCLCYRDHRWATKPRIFSINPLKEKVSKPFLWRMGQSFLILLISGNFGLSVYHKVKFWILFIFPQWKLLLCLAGNSWDGLHILATYVTAPISSAFPIWFSGFASALCMWTYSRIHRRCGQTGVGIPSLAFSFSGKEPSPSYPTPWQRQLGQPSILRISMPGTLWFPLPFNTTHATDFNCSEARNSENRELQTILLLRVWTPHPNLPTSHHSLGLLDSCFLKYTLVFWRKRLFCRILAITGSRNHIFRIYGFRKFLFPELDYYVLASDWESKNFFRF